MQSHPTAKDEGARLRSMREVLGLSRSQLAGRLGISAVTVRNAENGNQRLGLRSWAAMERLCKGEPAVSEARFPLTAEDGGPVYGGASAEAIIRQALRDREDPKIVAAAKAFAEVTGKTYDDALAHILAARVMP